MSGIISFFTVCTVILLLSAFALGMELVVFLETYIWPISIILWGILIWGIKRAITKEQDEEAKRMLVATPFCLLPSYCFLVQSLNEIVHEIKGVELFFAVCIELPLCMSFTLILGIVMEYISTRFRNIKVVFAISLVGNLLITAWLLSLGL